MRIYKLVLILLFIGISVNFVFATEPIKIGCPLSTSFLYGRNSLRGITLAVEEINKNGGVIVNGEQKQFHLEVINTRDLEPAVPVTEALLAVKKLIVEKEVDFLMGGPVRSEAALATMPLVSKHKIITIQTVGALSPKYHRTVSSDYLKYKYCFKMHSDAGYIVDEMLNSFELLKEKYGLTRIYIMVQDVAHARAAGELMKELAPSRGLEIVGLQAFPTGCQIYTGSLMKAKQLNVDILNIWMDMPESAILLKQWYNLKVRALPFGSTLAAAEHPSFWNITNGKGEYTLCNVISAGNASSNATKWTMKFYNSYTKRWGIEPEGFGCSSGYMAPYVLKDAIERANTLNTDKVIKALEKTDILGVYGRIQFDQKSHQVISSNDPKKGAVSSIIQWQCGKRIVVYPRTISTGDILLPSWMK